MVAETTKGEARLLQKWMCGVACIAALVFAASGTASPAVPTYSRDALIADARELAQTIESAHPDPFTRCGGRIPFYLELERILEEIPEAGLGRDEFVRRLRPLVAMVGDGHTLILDPYSIDDAYPGGIPLRFAVVEQSLYVTGVLSVGDEKYLGDLLVSVEGVGVDALTARLRGVVGLENGYSALNELAERSLWYGPYLAELLPEWGHRGTVRVGFRAPDGTESEAQFALPRATAGYHESRSAVCLPAVSSAGFYAGLVPYESLIDDDALGRLIEGAEQTEAVGYIRIDNQGGFRERLEDLQSAGSPYVAAGDLSSVPSATEEFRDLVVAMAEAETQTLIVDLRSDTGGGDRMADILVYFLYGYEGLRAYRGDMYVHGGFSVMRYSALYFENCPNESIDDINAGRAGVPLAVGECDVEDYRGREAEMQEVVAQTDIVAFLGPQYESSPTFYREFASGTYAGAYCPTHVMVLVSPKTFSAGFTTMEALSLNGATLVGTPSGQPLRAFGNGTLWQLDNTGLRGLVPQAYYNPYPNDPTRSLVWPVEVPMTYETLARHRFDPNASVLLALDWIAAPGR
jgi:hypothetical protein